MATIPNHSGGAAVKRLLAAVRRSLGVGIFQAGGLRTLSLSILTQTLIGTTNDPQKVMRASKLGAFG